MVRPHPRVLLSTVPKPLGVLTESCTPNIQAEMYHAQLTRDQGIFSIRSPCTGWGLDLIAANLDAPTTVLHYPTRETFARELAKGYDFVGIGFVICTYPLARELSRLVRQHAPQSRLIFGGYGTVLSECDAQADLVCREEGVAFMRRVLGEPPRQRMTVPSITRRLEVLGIAGRPEAILPVGLGCSRGCDFCSTSHFFDRAYVPLLRSGREIHEAMRAVDLPGRARTIGVIDEDFLVDRSRMEEIIALNRTEVERPILFSCLTSLDSLRQYSDDELIDMGLAGAWVGVESRQARYPKLLTADARETFARLRRLGVVTVASMMLGLDGHDETNIELDLEYVLSLEPAFTQFMLYSPCPHTPLYKRLRAAGRLRSLPYQLYDGYHALATHPRLDTSTLETTVDRFYAREYQALGPSVCRVLETQLAGYDTLRASSKPLHRARAAEHRALALELYPLLDPAIQRAPSRRAHDRLVALKRRARHDLALPWLTRAKALLSPAAARVAELREWLQPVRQPPTVIRRFRWQ